MNSLYKFIKESVSVLVENKTARFNTRVEIPADPAEWLRNFYANKSLRYGGLDNDKLITEISNVIKLISGNKDMMAVLSEDESVKYFKIPYDYADTIKKCSHNIILTENHCHVQHEVGNKYKILYWNGSAKFKILETGSGSQCVGTPFQEMMTCVTFNMMSSEKPSIDEIEIRKCLESIMLLDSSASKSCFKKKAKNGVPELNSEGIKWVDSWINHAKLIIEYLGGKNPKLMAIRYSSDDGLNKSITSYNEYIDVVNSNIGSDILSHFPDGLRIVINSYNKALQEIRSINANTDEGESIYASQKDHIDKSDIFVISTDDSDINQIKETFDSISSENYKITIPGIRKLNDDKIFLGVSLKKVGATGKIERSDSKMIKIVSNVQIKKPVMSMGYLANECRVTFTTDNNNTMLLTARSFGKNFGCDIKELEGDKELIALGKVPIELVRKNITQLPDGCKRLNSPDKILKYVSNEESPYFSSWDHKDLRNLTWKDTNDHTINAWKFLMRCAYGKDVEDMIKLMVNAALATTDYCFPFIIIH